jgi:hypothetical protein
MLFLAACSGGGHKSSGSSSDNKSALGADAPATSSPTPAPTATPADTPTPEATIAGPPTIITSLNTRCALTDAGADLTVDYTAKVAGTTVQSVQLLDNGKVVNDSGVINKNEYTTEFVIHTDASSRHLLEMQIQVPGASAPRSVRNSAVCPAPAAPAGPRA